MATNVQDIKRLLSSLHELLSVLNHQYILMRLRDRLRCALRVSGSQRASVCVSGELRSRANELFSSLAPFFTTPSTTVTIGGRRKILSVLTEVIRAFATHYGLSEDSYQTPEMAPRTIDIVDRIMPPGVKYSVVMLLSPLSTIVTMDCASIAAHLEEQIREEMHAKNLAGSIQVVYKSHGEALQKL
jgi:hypothetical protein